MLRLHKARSGFTLIELLVVIALILVLTTLAVAFIPNMAQLQRAADGAGMLQGWLNIARQRALRDQLPRGIRLFPDSNNSNVCTEAQYLDQPDDLIGNTDPTQGAVVTLSVSSSNLQAATLSGLDISNGGMPANQWLVLQHDHLEIGGSGLVHELDTPTGSGTSYQLPLLLSNIPVYTFPFPIASTPNFRIIRQPRVSGEEKLILPSNIGVDLTTYSQFSGGTPVDILFSPSGNVIGNQAGQNQIVLWVYDTTDPSVTGGGAPTGGSSSLIVINVRSGLISSVEIGPSGNYYQFVTSP